MEELSTLIQLASRGNQAACKKIYDQHVAYCYGICMRYGILKIEMKDILQIIFSAVFMSLDSYNREQASFKTWMTRIAINKIIDHRRKKTKHQGVSYLEEMEIQDQQSMDSKINKDYIFYVLSKMPHQYSEVFNLFVVDGYSHKEIAEKLNITEMSSRTKLRRARDWVKDTLGTRLKTSTFYG